MSLDLDEYKEKLMEFIASCKSGEAFQKLKSFSSKHKVTFSLMLASVSALVLSFSGNIFLGQILAGFSFGYYYSNKILESFFSSSWYNYRPHHQVDGIIRACTDLLICYSIPYFVVSSALGILTFKYAGSYFCKQCCQAGKACEKNLQEN